MARYCCRVFGAACYPCVMDSSLWSRIEQILTAELVVVESRHDASRKRFDCVMQEFPSGRPRPDGAERIHEVGREVHAALVAYLNALKRYTDFILYHTVPDDLDLTKTQPD